VAAKFIEANGIVLKLRFPSGQEALSYLNTTLFWALSAGKPFLERVCLGTSLLPEVPAKFNDAEVAAIKDGKLFRGMKGDAVPYVLGLPTKENDWGIGGKQLIYGKSLLIYVDTQGLVTDWQVLDNR